MTVDGNVFRLTHLYSKICMCHVSAFNYRNFFARIHSTVIEDTITHSQITAIYRGENYYIPDHSFVKLSNVLYSIRASATISRHIETKTFLMQETPTGIKIKIINTLLLLINNYETSYTTNVNKSYYMSLKLSHILF